MTLFSYALFSGCALCVLAIPAAADVDEQSIDETFLVVGSQSDAFAVAGSAAVISQEELMLFEYTDISRILRTVPGVYLQEEDGFGLRPNIGLRGSGTERSEKITLLEDGVLIAPAPYSAPAAYYFPTAARMSTIEVLKGPAAITQGPRTVGGAINLVSTPISETLSGNLEARFGSDDFYEVHGVASGMANNLGALVEVYRSGSNGFKTLENGGDTGFEIEDYVMKLRVQSDPDANYPQVLEFKGQYYQQTSNETYLGITDEDFAVDPTQRYAASQNDRFESEHWQLQLSHNIDLSDTISVATQAYYNDFKRNWFKVDDLDFGDGRGRIRPTTLFNDPTDPLNVAGLAVLRGDVDSVDDAIQLRNNNREYYAWGIQTAISAEFETGSVEHVLDIGIRYHEDEEDRLQNRENFRMENGTLVPTSVDTIGSQGNRVVNASAWAVYVRDTITVGALTLTPGIRAEFIDLQRADFGADDPVRTEGATDVRENSVTAFAPGIGATYKLSDSTILLAGIHRGINPPGASDDGPEEETSLNFEAGVRYSSDIGRLEVVGFYNKYSNILGTCTNAVACIDGDIGDQFNGGDARVFGLEVAASAEPYISDTVRVPLRLAYTFTDAQFTESFSNSFFGTVVEGDELDFIPSHILFLSAGIASDAWSVTMNMNHVSAQRTVAGQGEIDPLERIDAYTVFDLAADYTISERFRLFASLQNVFDSRYAVSRLPYGLRSGRPQTIIGGIGVQF